MCNITEFREENGAIYSNEVPLNKLPQRTDVHVKEKKKKTQEFYHTKFKNLKDLLMQILQKPWNVLAVRGNFYCVFLCS